MASIHGACASATHIQSALQLIHACREACDLGQCCTPQLLVGCHRARKLIGLPHLRDARGSKDYRL